MGEWVYDGRTMSERIHCPHNEIWPNGDCTECGMLVTTVPGLQSQHRVRQRIATMYVIVHKRECVQDGA